MRGDGGFGGAPKFPRPTELLFLLREYARTGDDERPRHGAAHAAGDGASAACAITSAAASIATRWTRDWRVPHFEKMLYDQAQLVLAYLEAAQVTGDAFFADVADDTLRYVARDMTDAAGGFYSAEDADSVPPERGRTNRRPASLKARSTSGGDDELDALLGDDAALVRAAVRRSSPAATRRSIRRASSPGRTCSTSRRRVEDCGRAARASAPMRRRSVWRARASGCSTRSRPRPRPHLDDKVLTAWNGLMIAAFARAARVHCAAAAHLRGRAAGGSVRSRRVSGSPSARTLCRRYRDGDAAIAGYAEDYAYLIWGLLELFQADGDPAWLEWAIELQRRQDELFWDAQSGGWFSTTGEDPSVLVRMKEDYDGAEPSASSVSAANLVLLAHLTGDPQYHARVERTFGGAHVRLTGAGRSVPMMLAALSAWHAGVQQIVLVGSPQAAALREMAAAVSRRHLPFAVTLIVEPGAQQERLARTVPLIGAMTMTDGQPTAYVCRDFACHAPVTSPDALFPS